MSDKICFAVLLICTRLVCIGLICTGLISIGLVCIGPDGGGVGKAQAASAIRLASAGLHRGHGTHTSARKFPGATTDQAFAREFADHDAALTRAHRELSGWLLSRWPLPVAREIIGQLAKEQSHLQQTHQTNDDDQAAHRELLASREALQNRLRELLPVVQVDWTPAGVMTRAHQPLKLVNGLSSVSLIEVFNRTGEALSLRAIPGDDYRVADFAVPTHWTVPPGKSVLFPIELLRKVDEAEEEKESRLTLRLERFDDPAASQQLGLRYELSEPATIRGTLIDEDLGDAVAGRVFVLGRDQIFRHAERFQNKKTFIDKPVIFPPIGVWQRLPFFYSERTFKVKVPPGDVEVRLGRGYEHREVTRRLSVEPGEELHVELATERLADPAEEGWISGDTHVHWVTNQWNVDEPLDLLALVQRAEDVRVANNLTLLQRYANQAFIKPSQAAMGPIARISDAEYHAEMGEEYRNEDLYGHLCFLNLRWLVQPIGTGEIIAGPDALDYPLNKTAIEACREQGGISIEAHGLGGNKDVPANVVHGLTDSLDQVNPDMYYRFLDAGFQLPLTNGSDHPARRVGQARAYVQVEGEFTYAKWIEGIRRGRTFTTSGPLLFLTVNERPVGETLDVNAETLLRVHLRAISRHPLGTVQIISNHEIVREVTTDQRELELQWEMPAEKPRWIVARCAPAEDNPYRDAPQRFNAIFGPDVAHTSAIYVQVDGASLHNPEACRFWANQLRQHARDIELKGRFANERQRQEAVSYIEESIELYEQLPRFYRQARQRGETVEQLAERLRIMLTRTGWLQTYPQWREQLSACEYFEDLKELLAPITLADISINPESRVKISSRLGRLTVQRGKPYRFLLHIDNIAGITAPLRLMPIDLASANEGTPGWCSLRLVESPWISRYLNGSRDEYKLVELVVHEAGLRELRLTADAGQGTQDLGFRATVDLVLEATEPLEAKGPLEATGPTR